MSSGTVAEALRAGELLPGEDGPLQSWPAYRRALLHLILDAGEPMLYVRGRARATLYNDAALALLDSVTAKLGAPLAEYWPECVDTVERTLDGTTLASAVEIRPTTQQYPAVDKLQDSTVNDMPGGNVSGCISTIARDGEGNVDGVICRISGPHSAFAAGPESASEATDAVAYDKPIQTQRRVEPAEVRQREQLMGSVREVETMLDAAVGAIITIDATGLVRSVNAAAVAMFGHAREGMLGRNVDMLMPEEHRRHHDSYLQRYMTTGEARIIGIGRELEGQRKDGSTFPIYLSVGEFIAGGHRFFIGIIHDLTERRRAEKALRQAQKLESIGQLSGGIAHDFNNLLTVVDGNLELLEQHLACAAKTERELVAEARDAAHRGAALTARLLAFARREPLDSEVIAPAKLIADLMHLLHRTLGDTIIVQTTIDSDAWLVQVDRAQFESAIVNLSINARDAMPCGGTLAIEVANLCANDTRLAPVPALASGDYVRLSVSDEGCGMTPDVMARAFEPFYTTKEVGKGTGLGLSTVFGFAHRSGGHLSVASEPGVGTMFDVYLPRCEQSLAGGFLKTENTEPASGAVDASRTATILVVEDDPQVRRLTAGRLLLLGHSVVEAADGPRALELLEQHPDIRLVLSDVVMPGGMSGHDVARAVRRRWPEVSLLLTSAFAAAAREADTVLDPPVPMLTKPYEQAALARAVAAALA